MSLPLVLHRKRSRICRGARRYACGVVIKKHIITAIDRRSRGCESPWSSLIAGPSSSYHAPGCRAAARAARRGLAAPSSGARSPAWWHCISPFGELKYPDGFKQFDYVYVVVPPKGGSARQIALGPFDNFNRRRRWHQGLAGARHRNSCHEQASRGLARRASSQNAADQASQLSGRLLPATFRSARLSELESGKPVAPEDVIFSFNASSKSSPQVAGSYRHVVKVEKTGEREIAFKFDAPGNRKLPQIMGQLRPAPDERWEGADRTARSATSAKRRSSRRSATASDRIKEFAPAVRSSTSASRTIGARASTSTPVATVSPTALRVFPRRDGRHRGVQGQHGRLA